MGKLAALPELPSLPNAAILASGIGQYTFSIFVLVWYNGIFKYCTFGDYFQTCGVHCIKTI